MCHVRRILYGYNQGQSVQSLIISTEAKNAAHDGKFDLQAYRFVAASEQLRQPRKVRIGLVQNSIVLPTTAPYAQQRDAILGRIRQLVDAAAKCGTQVLCLQEAFHMPFAFCTREREWCEFAEPVEGGPSVLLCQELAVCHGMVIVCPILERDPVHCETVWNTAVVIGHRGNIIGKHRKVSEHVW
jgi:beta-ureidopropionase